MVDVCLGMHVYIWVYMKQCLWYYFDRLMMIISCIMQISGYRNDVYGTNFDRLSNILSFGADFEVDFWSYCHWL